MVNSKYVGAVTLLLLLGPAFVQLASAADLSDPLEDERWKRVTPDGTMHWTDIEVGQVLTTGRQSGDGCVNMDPVRIYIPGAHEGRGLRIEHNSVCQLVVAEKWGPTVANHEGAFDVLVPQPTGHGYGTNEWVRVYVKLTMDGSPSASAVQDSTQNYNWGTDSNGEGHVVTSSYTDYPCSSTNTQVIYVEDCSPTQIITSATKDCSWTCQPGHTTIEYEGEYEWTNRQLYQTNIVTATYGWSDGAGGCYWNWYTPEGGVGGIPWDHSDTDCTGSNTG